MAIFHENYIDVKKKKKKLHQGNWRGSQVIKIRKRLYVIKTVFVTIVRI